MARAAEYGARPRGPRPRRPSAGRIGLYGFLVIAALFFLMPLYVMIVTSLKDMAEIRLGNLFALPADPTFAPWIKAWSAACTGVACDGIRPGFVNSVKITVLAVIISVAIGAVAGYFGGRLDGLIQRFVDAWMTFPDLVLLIVVISVLGPGASQIIVVLGLLYGIGGSRIIRSAVMSVRENTYTRAAQSMGAGWGHILLRHILPNIAPVIIVLFTTRIGAVILVEAGLSFLGLGVPPPAPTWGGMLSGTGRTYMYVGPWLALAPGLCLAVAVYSINIFGDALRDLLDPRMRSRR